MWSFSTNLQEHILCTKKRKCGINTIWIICNLIFFLFLKNHQEGCKKYLLKILFAYIIVEWQIISIRCLQMRLQHLRATIECIRNSQFIEDIFFSASRMDLPFFNHWCCSGTLPFDYQCVEGDKTYYSQDLDTIAIDNEKGTCIFLISDGF